MENSTQPLVVPEIGSGPVQQPILTRRDDTAGGSHLADVQSHYFLRGEQTGNAYSMTEIVFQPGAQGTPTHRHHREDELYYVIEGKLEAHVGDQRVTLEAGSSLLLPRGIKHKVSPTGNVPTRVLMIITPPGLEKMLATLDKLNKSELDLDALHRLAIEYQVDMLPD